MGAPRRRAAGLLALVAFVLHPASARAHSVGVSRGEYRLSGGGVEAQLVFAGAEVAAAVPGLDADGNGSVSAAELAREGPLLGEAIVSRLELRTPIDRCRGTLLGAALMEQDGLAVRAAFRCGRGAGGLTLRAGFLDALSPGHRHLVSVKGAGGEVRRDVLYGSHPELRLTASAGGAAETASTVAWPLLRVGVEHILTGYDHLVFLLGLILVGGRLRSLLLAVTAFTVAHSITLGLAALGVWAPSPRIVEPAIALSIAYVGVENWFVEDAARRWLITFPFGLIHGFGFAGALEEIALPTGQVPLALVAFNAGVELGQVAVLAVVLPAVLWLGKARWFADRGVKATSAAIALAGLSWFVLRLA